MFQTQVNQLRTKRTIETDWLADSMIDDSMELTPKKYQVDSDSKDLLQSTMSKLNISNDTCRT